LITVATCLWDANQNSHYFSRCYSDEWVDKLYRGFARNLTVPFEFVLFTDKPRKFNERIKQQPLVSKNPDYGCFTEPYKLNEPMILVGLDTVIVGNIDHFADYCMSADKIALLRDPKSYRLKDQGYPDQSINGVAFVPRGWRRIYDEWTGGNDMLHLRKYPWEPIDDKWPREQIVSYKLSVRPNGDALYPDTRVVFFHGKPKPSELTHLDWVKTHWR
jgi:hypothetical protein